jgi:hypothetical protein
MRPEARANGRSGRPRTQLRPTYPVEGIDVLCGSGADGASQGCQLWWSLPRKAQHEILGHASFVRLHPGPAGASLQTYVLQEREDGAQSRETTCPNKLSTAACTWGPTHRPISRSERRDDGPLNHAVAELPHHRLRNDRASSPHHVTHGSHRGRHQGRPSGAQRGLSTVLPSASLDRGCTARVVRSLYPPRHRTPRVCESRQRWAGPLRSCTACPEYQPTMAR